MTRPTLLIAAGLVLALLGVVWTLQGLGYLAGSAMTGVTIWAVIGPVLALVGVGVLVAGLRGRRSSTSRTPDRPDGQRDSA